MGFDEKQRRRDKWNKKRDFRKKDRFKNKPSTRPVVQDDFDPNRNIPEHWMSDDLDN